MTVDSQQAPQPPPQPPPQLPAAAPPPQQQFPSSMETAVLSTQAHMQAAQAAAMAQNASSLVGMPLAVNVGVNVAAAAAAAAAQGPSGAAYGRRGDPRMHRALAAKVANPKLTLLDALITGGFLFPRLGEPGTSDRTIRDTENVLLYQRKNQLNRRLRLAKSLRGANGGFGGPGDGPDALKGDDGKGKRGKRRKGGKKDSALGPDLSGVDMGGGGTPQLAPAGTFPMMMPMSGMDLQSVNMMMGQPGPAAAAPGDGAALHPGMHGMQGQQQMGMMMNPAMIGMMPMQMQPMSQGGNPLGGNSLGGNPLGGNSLGGNPLGGNHLVGNPFVNMAAIWGMGGGMAPSMMVAQQQQMHLQGQGGAPLPNGEEVVASIGDVVPAMNDTKKDIEG